LKKAPKKMLLEKSPVKKCQIEKKKISSVELGLNGRGMRGHQQEIRKRTKK